MGLEAAAGEAKGSGGPGQAAGWARAAPSALVDRQGHPCCSSDRKRGTPCRPAPCRIPRYFHDLDEGCCELFPPASPAELEGNVEGGERWGYHAVLLVGYDRRNG